MTVAGPGRMGMAGPGRFAGAARMGRTGSGNTRNLNAKVGTKKIRLDASIKDAMQVTEFRQPILD
jgi:hypothetical protein